MNLGAIWLCDKQIIPNSRMIVAFATARFVSTLPSYDVNTDFVSERKIILQGTISSSLDSLSSYKVVQTNHALNSQTTILSPSSLSTPTTLSANSNFRSIFNNSNDTSFMQIMSNNCDKEIMMVD
ncbi:hypothetical protein RO3G_07662 [Rhizopus delemar RA 99-880]|uniref:Uncharacterized protein n=1 Tax=Rhizopus delemar (strain RA 99-880 / ATCC MYA-4621 / FGSC 9543 / NRRL 43880) TaxID=246409 RepID=I1C3C7_RHIO9|nr:hypothetical protein RO3G_07662 [Rhizopus delemar RA 99-880]|eukprot:EIE82957.1 hypothetical protein RO3G_07662 [Rhizopus delemar RA 99-880]